MNEVISMNQLFTPGDIIYGFCNGFFGRDDYEKKICVMVNDKFAVFVYEDGTGTLLNFNNLFTENMIKNWKKE